MSPQRIATTVVCTSVRAPCVNAAPSAQPARPSCRQGVARERLDGELGDVARGDRVAPDHREAVTHHRRTVRAGRRDGRRLLRRRLLGANDVDPPPDPLLHPHPRTARAAAHRMVAREIELERLVLAHRSEHRARRLVFAVVAREIAGLVVNHALVSICLTPSRFSVLTNARASVWNSISLPARRTHSPVDVSAAPRRPMRTPAAFISVTNARAIFCPRGSNDSAEPT